jgi:hypothetical protein
MAQRILAYYFPQYHSIPENDIVFGKDFSDWDLFKAKTHEELTAFKTPIEPPEGLGYYDLTEHGVRATQANLAKKYGVDGFIYYHYWLENKPVMNTVFEKKLEDSEPNIPFCLCFANESWKHNYGSSSGGYKAFHPDGSTFRQLYDNPKEHAAYLAKLFIHPNYIRVNSLPLLFVYKYGPEVSVYLESICSEIPGGVYIVACTSNYCLQHYDHTKLIRKPSAYSPFDAHHYINPGQRPVPESLSGLPCIYGGFMGWNSMLRHPTFSLVHDLKPTDITVLICKKLLQMRYDVKSPQILTIFAWNEWAEGAVIEPNSIYGEELGLAIRKAREIVERLTDLYIEYGLNDVFIDITERVYAQCLNAERLIIPADDYLRARMFGDPLPGIVKIIKVTWDGVITVYEHTDTITLMLTATMNQESQNQSQATAPP